MNHQQNIKVLVRVRPSLSNDQRSCIKINDAQNQISIFKNKNEHKLFIYDYVADINTKQIEIMELIGKPITEKCIDGYNATIFAYGQTGSGKTYTMQGEPTANGSEKYGLMPNIFAYLFQLCQDNKSKDYNLEYMIKVSCLEIYNNQLRDLLSLDNNRHKLEIMKCPSKKGTGFYVKNLSYHICNSAKDCLSFVRLATKNRETATTKMNDKSSRSHLIFTLTITKRTMLNDIDININAKSDNFVNSRTSRLHLVDLAGSERQKKSKASGDRLKEAQHINKSLSTLSLVISKIIKNEKHIPFRDSPLTRILENSLGGDSLTHVIANISPSFSDYSETLSTLQFVDRVKQIKNTAKIVAMEHDSLDTLKAENSKFVNMIQEWKAKYEVSQREKNELNQKNNKLNELLKAKDDQNNQLNDMLKQKEDMIKALQKEITREKSTNIQLNSELNIQQQKMQQLKDKDYLIKELENKIKKEKISQYSIKL